MIIRQKSTPPITTTQQNSALKYEKLIAKRFLQRDSSNLSRSLLSIATWSIALAVLVMVMAVSILRGFQHNIEQKVVGFGSHIVVRSQKVGNYYEETPIQIDRQDLKAVAHTPGVRHVQGVAQKGGMVKTDEQIQGVILKGIGTDYDTTFLHSILVEGSLPSFLKEHNDTAALLKGKHIQRITEKQLPGEESQQRTAAAETSSATISNAGNSDLATASDYDTTIKPSNEIILSRSLAKKLGLKVGDKVRTYFWSGSTYRARAFKLVGLFNTDMPELDDHYIVTDLRQVQKLNGWSPNQVASLEVELDNFDKLNVVANQLYSAIGYDLTLSTIVEDNTALFAWLDLLNSNIVLILTVMAIVCVVAIISSLLIMIFEKTQMIGVLKTLGATNSEVRKIFIIKALRIAGRAIAIGCAIALVLSVVQAQWHIIKLNSESYSMSYVPMEISVPIYFIIAAGTLLVCLLAMLLPASYITRIEPAKTIRFE